MKLKELMASLQRLYEIYGDIKCVLLDSDGNINPLEVRPDVKYEQCDELFDFYDERLSLKDLSEAVLVINPQL